MRTFLVTIALVAVAGAVAPAAQAAQAPTISASPTSIMVNQSTNLVGHHFPKLTTITLSECGRQSWVVPQRFCGTNTVSVTTNARGVFRTPFKVTLCPHGVRGPVTSQTCYVGEVEPQGVDTVGLVGAVQITVTYP